MELIHQLLLFLADFRAPVDFFLAGELFLAVDLVDFLAVRPDFFAAVLRFLGAAFLAPPLLAAAFFAPRFFGAAFFAPFLRGTLAPASLASDRPIAIAWRGFLTFFPLRPEVNLPRFISCIARSTFCCDFFEYLAMWFVLIKR